MAQTHEWGRIAIALGIPVLGSLGFTLAVNYRDRRSALASRALSERMGLPLVPPDAGERAVLVQSGLSGGETGVRWEAPDAAFYACFVGSRKAPEGVVVVSPRGGAARKPRLADALRRLSPEPSALPLPGDVAQRSPGVQASRVGARLVVRRPGVATAEELEGLVMSACAILDG